MKNAIELHRKGIANFGILGKAFGITNKPLVSTMRIMLGVYLLSFPPVEIFVNNDEIIAMVLIMIMFANVCCILTNPQSTC